MNLKKLADTPPWDWPENASALILDTLTNRQASMEDRLLAAELGGDYVVLSEKVAGALLNIVRSSDEPAELRSKAAIGLGPGLEESATGDYDDLDDPPALSEPFVHKMQQALHGLYSDATVPKDVRRAILEASVRDPQNWHAGAIRSAYSSNDKEWLLTAVFCMQYVKGFDKQILESLDSPDESMHYHAVIAAGNWEIDAAWPHIARLVTSSATEKVLLLAAIEAAASIRPTETDIIEPLVDSYDEDIAEAASEALTMAGFAADDFEDLDEDEEDDDYEADEDEDDEDYEGDEDEEDEDYEPEEEDDEEDEDEEDENNKK